MYTLLYLKWITNKDLLYSTGSSAQCYVEAWMEGEFGGECESHLVLSDFLRPHGLYSPRNSPGQNTRVGSLSLPHRIFLTQGSNPGIEPIVGGFFTSYAAREVQEYWSG